MITLKSAAETSFVIKKSRFIGFACRTDSEHNAHDMIEQRKKTHYDATHNCFAYLLENGAMRYSDDGEPQGTAGLPVLDIIRHAGMVDAAVVVTRYFGGTLLGKGGLVRAYSETASLAVEDAGIAVMTPCVRLEISCDYQYYDRLMRLIDGLPGTVDEAEFADRVRVLLTVAEPLAERLELETSELTRGASLPRLVEKIFLPVAE